MIHLIGAGGVGSWLLPKLVKLASAITVHDGDTLELKNLDRQLFDQDQVGQKKATALANKYSNDKCQVIPVTEYLTPRALTLARRDFLFCCADNHSARKEVLALCDRFDCSAILAANEYTDAEAYLYVPDMLGTPNDPRVIYPAILTDDRDDPTRPASCQGHAAEANPQLVLANDWASGLALHLYWYHTKGESRQYPQEFWPIHNKVSCHKFSTIRWGDRLV